MELKLRPALMSLLALSGAATTANAATGVEDTDEPVTPVDSAEWATNSSAAGDPGSNVVTITAPDGTAANSRPIDPGQAPARSGDPTAKTQPAPLPDATPPPDNQNLPYHWLDTTRRVLYNTLWKSSQVRR